VGNFSKQMRKKNKQGKLRIPLWTPFQESEAVKNGNHIPMSYLGFDKMYVNSRYTVLVRSIGTGQYGKGVHLSIRRNDREAIHDWRDLQRIKNELVGPETEAVEIYPAESRMVDTSNQYHLWCFTNFQFPFGYTERLVLDNTQAFVSNTKQRDFEHPVETSTVDDVRQLYEREKEMDYRGTKK
jgi:hypothetical protein